MSAPTIAPSPQAIAPPPAGSKLNPRRVVANVLLQIGRFHQANPEKRLFADELLEHALQHASSSEGAFARHLLYSTCRFWFGWDAVLADFLKQNGKKNLDERLLVLLKLGFTELSALCQTPDYAVLSEVMSVAKGLKLPKHLQGLLYGCLKNYSRSQKPLPNHVLPQWIKQTLAYQQGQKGTLAQLEQALMMPPKGLSIRINTLKGTVSDYLALLEAQGIVAQQPDPQILPEWLYMEKRLPLEALPGYNSGWVVPQNPSAQLACQQLGVQPNHTVLEVGAAPGGKTAYLASLMGNTGHITAVDIDETRLAKMQHQLQQLGVSNVTPLCTDLSQAPLPQTGFDVVLIDAPCSASGIIGHHPDVLMQLTPTQVTNNTATQFALIKAGFEALKPGGVMVYATCSLFAMENRSVVERLLYNQHGRARLLVETTVWPTAPDWDGFYIAKIQKSEA